MFSGNTFILTFKLELVWCCVSLNLPTNLFSGNVDSDTDEHETKKTREYIKIIFVMEIQLFGIIIRLQSYLKESNLL